MSGWHRSERILLAVVVVFAALAAYRLLAGGAPSAEPVAPAPSVPEDAPSSAAAVPVRPAGAPPSPAGAELLARIRSCSEQDLEGIVDHISATEALGIYRELAVSDRVVVLSALPAATLARKAQELLGIPERHFRQAGRPGLLASSLLDAAMGGSGSAPTSRTQDLLFATTIDEDGVPEERRSRFAPEHRKIYACLDGGAEFSGDPPGVLVRWTEQESGVVVHLHYMPFAINRRWNYVSFETAADWPPGTYRVSLYRIGAAAALFAEGSYVIEKGI